MSEAPARRPRSVGGRRASTGGAGEGGESRGRESRGRESQGRDRRFFRLLGWNLGFLAAGLFAVALAGEVWLRLTTPFIGSHHPRRFVPEVGLIGERHATLRWTNGLDYWQVSRTNRWGFADREPIPAGVAAAGCHVALIGDSYVEGKEVPLADRTQVVLEALAAKHLPRLGITASAFGRGGTGQVSQLAIYDEYVRRMRPKVLALFFHFNDFADNSTILSALVHGFDPERLPFLSVARDAGGRFRLRPPDPNYNDYRLAQASGLSESVARTLASAWEAARGASFFLEWMYAEAAAAVRSRFAGERAERAGTLAPDLPIPELLERWGSGSRYLPRAAAVAIAQARSSGEPMNPVLEEAWDATAFAFDEFAARAERDGVALVVLVTHQTRVIGGEAMDAALRSLAEPRGIPVLDHHQAIVRRGFDPREARWPHDDHWNANGHRWAAEVLLEYLEEHPEVCEGR